MGESNRNDNKKQKLKCGLVMPISEIDGLNESHWSEVKSIIKDSLSKIEEYEISTELVSESDNTGIIQAKIVQNIFDSDIIICDVSRKNPNVMFELGLRLAFDKPIIIIKDLETNYSFDTSPIEHLLYDSKLTYINTLDFQKKLQSKFIATFKSHTSSPDANSYLKHFGKFRVSKIETKEVTSDEVIFKKLEEMNTSIEILNSRISKRVVNNSNLISSEQLLQKGINRFLNKNYRELIADNLPFKQEIFLEIAREFNLNEHFTSEALAKEFCRDIWDTLEETYSLPF